MKKGVLNIRIGSVKLLKRDEIREFRIFTEGPFYDHLSPESAVIYLKMLKVIITYIL